MQDFLNEGLSPAQTGLADVAVNPMHSSRMRLPSSSSSPASTFASIASLREETTPTYSPQHGDDDDDDGMGMGMGMGREGFDQLSLSLSLLSLCSLSLSLSLSALSLSGVFRSF
jgi:hypothetical protein